jgi:hypothetical protein
LGRWPNPYNPDPKALGFDFHHLFIWYSSLVVLISPLLLIYMFLITFKVIKLNAKQYAMAASIFVFFLTACIFLCKYDPGKFIEWFAD